MNKEQHEIIEDLLTVVKNVINPLRDAKCLYDAILDTDPTSPKLLEILNRGTGYLPFHMQTLLINARKLTLGNHIKTVLEKGKYIALEQIARRPFNLIAFNINKVEAREVADFARKYLNNDIEPKKIIKTAYSYFKPGYRLYQYGKKAIPSEFIKEVSRMMIVPIVTTLAGKNAGKFADILIQSGAAYVDPMGFIYLRGLPLAAAGVGKYMAQEIGKHGKINQIPTVEYFAQQLRAYGIELDQELIDLVEVLGLEVGEYYSLDVSKYVESTACGQEVHSYVTRTKGKLERSILKRTPDTMLSLVETASQKIKAIDKTITSYIDACWEGLGFNPNKPVSISSVEHQRIQESENEILAYQEKRERAQQEQGALNKNLKQLEQEFQKISVSVDQLETTIKYLGDVNVISLPNSAFDSCGKDNKEAIAEYIANKMISDSVNYQAAWNTVKQAMLTAQEGNPKNHYNRLKDQIQAHRNAHLSTFNQCLIAVKQNVLAIIHKQQNFRGQLNKAESETSELSKKIEEAITKHLKEFNAYQKQAFEQKQKREQQLRFERYVRENLMKDSQGISIDFSVSFETLIKELEKGIDPELYDKWYAEVSRTGGITIQAIDGKTFEIMVHLYLKNKVVAHSTNGTVDVLFQIILNENNGGLDYNIHKQVDITEKPAYKIAPFGFTIAKIKIGELSHYERHLIEDHLSTKVIPDIREKINAWLFDTANQLNDFANKTALSSIGDIHFNQFKWSLSKGAIVSNNQLHFDLQAKTNVDMTLKYSVLRDTLNSQKVLEGFLSSSGLELENIKFGDIEYRNNELIFHINVDGGIFLKNGLSGEHILKLKLAYDPKTKSVTCIDNSSVELDHTTMSIEKDFLETFPNSIKALLNNKFSDINLESLINQRISDNISELLQSLSKNHNCSFNISKNYHIYILNCETNENGILINATVSNKLASTSQAKSDQNTQSTFLPATTMSFSKFGKKRKNNPVDNQNYSKNKKLHMEPKIQAGYFFDTPVDGSSLFWAIALATLVPLSRGSKDTFDKMFNTMFTGFSIMFCSSREELSSIIKIREYIRTFLSNYKPRSSLSYINEGILPELSYLITVVFRKNVVKYYKDKFPAVAKKELLRDDHSLDWVECARRMEHTNACGGYPEIIAASHMLGINIEVQNGVGHKVTGGIQSIKIIYVDRNHYTLAPIVSSGQPESDIVLTVGDGNCAFHATLGTIGSDGWIHCQDITAERKKIADYIRSCTKDFAVYQYICEYISVIIGSKDETKYHAVQKKMGDLYEQYHKYCKSFSAEQAWGIFYNILIKHEKIIKNINEHHQLSEKLLSGKGEIEQMKQKFHNVLDHKAVPWSLRQAIAENKELSEAFAEYNKINQNNFPWETAITKRDIDAFAQFIQKDNEWLIGIGLAIIAYANNITVHYYSGPGANPVTYNAGQVNQVAVEHNGIDHFSRVSPQRRTQNITGILSEIGIFSKNQRITSLVCEYEDDDFTRLGLV